LSSVEIVIALVVPVVPGLMIESSVKVISVWAGIVMETKLLTTIALVLGVVRQKYLELDSIPFKVNAQL